ncbi:MAG TPA: ABC transporter ATP-binding protein [Pseudonocardiaceae bacterium]|nr:ABC transporter ATP-binding protein [Pseudonocardiaceae bacterium]
MSLLEITDLTVRFGPKTVVDGVSFALGQGERLGMIGESGSGKSLTALAAIGLLPEEASVTGSVKLDGLELLGLPDRALAKVRGEQVAMVFQEPLTALNPLMRIGKQLAEPLRLHRGLSAKAARAKAVELAGKVRLPDPDRIVRAFPHQLSGGQRQRVGIAIALACQPAVLIADEPTTALDVTVQAEILTLLCDLVDEQGASLLFITHDLAVLSSVVSRLVVLADGKLVEQTDIAALANGNHDPHTADLLRAARAAAFPAMGGPDAGR